MTAPRIAFLGLGIMGGGMARRLLDAGFPLAVYNRNPARAEPLIAAGARFMDTPRSAVAGADIIVSMVADDLASHAMWLGDSGALAGAERGAVCVECSTLTVAWVTELARAVSERRCEFVDAPVTGSKPAAAAGELNFLVGGTETALEKIRPAFAAMGRNVIHLGPTGSGAFVKLVNNFVAGVQVTAFAEAFALVERNGDIDRAKALAVISEGAPGSPIVKLMSARMTAVDYTPNFLLHLMAKDLGYAIEEGARHQLSLLTAAAALERFRAAINAGLGEKDMAAVLETVRTDTRPPA